MVLQDMRRRMPLIVFILLAIVCLVVLAIACACATDHPAQQIDRALSAIPAAPGLVEVWTFTFGALLLAPLLVRHRLAGNARSPAVLQCFLF